MPHTAAGLRRTVVDLLVGSVAVGLAWNSAGFDQPGMLLASLGAVVAVVTAVVAGSTLEQALPQPCATVLIAVGPWLAIYACVPETSDQMFHVAALLVVLGTTEVALSSRLPWWVHSATVGVVAWAGLYGSSGRSSAVVGAVFALWPFVLLPAALVLAPSFVRATAWAQDRKSTRLNSSH